jgi:predicted ABC-type ATPase
MPLLVMVAGPNGSGKSTLISALREDPVIALSLPRLYVNADDIQRETGFDSAAAQRAASELRTRALAQRRDVMYETVMSHPSKVAELQQARLAGYEVHLFFLATDNPAINVQRVSLRVASGGHAVPQDRILARYERTLSLAPSALSLADQAHVYDNTDSRRGLQAQAQLVDKQLIRKTPTPATWVDDLVTRYNERVSELDRLIERAMQRGWSLQAASLRSSSTNGPVTQLGSRYVVQQEVATGALVFHDRDLLPRESFKAGQMLRIAYADGVAAVETMRPDPERQGGTAEGRRHN